MPYGKGLGAVRKERGRTGTEVWMMEQREGEFGFKGLEGWLREASSLGDCCPRALLCRGQAKKMHTLMSFANVMGPARPR